MAPISADDNEAELRSIENKLKAGTFGAIVFTTGKHANPSETVSRFQSLSPVPLLFGMDGSTSLGIPQDSSFTFPSLLSQGAIANDSLISAMGAVVGKQMKRAGIHIEFIAANAISSKHLAGYGEDRFRAAAKALTYWKALQAQGVLACAKAFPVQGLNITRVDKNIPSVQLTVDSAEAYPFQVLLQNKLPLLMPASGDLPVFYPEEKTAKRNIPSSRALTASFAGSWIRQNTNFKGLVLIDVENMIRGSDKFSAGDAEVFAFKAGNDMMIISSNVGSVMRKMKKLLKKEKVFRSQLDATVKKILSLKYDAGLARKQQGLLPGPDPVKTKILTRNMFRAAVTVLTNRNTTLPIQSLDDKTFFCLAADDNEKGKIFSERFSKYIKTNVIHVNEKSDTLVLTDSLRPLQVIVITLFPTSREDTFKKLLALIQENKNREVIICDFGAPFFKSYANDFSTVITAYDDNRETLESVPEIIFGALPAEGISPVAFGALPAGQSIRTNTLARLTYSFPEEVGMDGKTLTKIQAIATEAIDMGATPGCHVLIAKDGKVIYEKSFGYLTYEKQDPVTSETIYDLASVTKVSATLQSVMFLYDRGLIDIHKKASFYLTELRNSNKKDFILQDILTHQAGLWPFLPFWTQTMQDSVHLPQYYSKTLSPAYPLVISDNLFGSKSMRDSLWTWIIKAKIREKPTRTPFDYRYSDMGFYILHHLSEQLLNQPMEDFLNQNLYEPLGASTTGYQPLLRFPINRIAPTENDRLFRKSLLIGTVHDQGAAMLGGIAGHAGLFSNANDLAKLGQMLLQEGYYGGTRFYKPETVRAFTQKQFETSRRGLGWDKPTPGEWNGPTSYYASLKTFGHTGFTGTCIWMDPEFKVVYIFLSNRVHPDMTNNKLLTANIRSRIQDVIYQSIFNYCKTAGDETPVPENTGVEALGKAQ